ncbi:retention in endoplasmic reticulum protein 1 [Borealophlyctis nickersoniae]|nr:retention in endoplasmic reticulum protein 1 [Borealophlyctis nickersoniae]
MASLPSNTGADTDSQSAVSQRALMFQRMAQKYLDDTAPYYIHRWTFTVVALILFLARVFIVHGWYIVTYALGIYLLNLFLAFLTPKFDPAMEDLSEEDKEGPSLPTRADDEFRPFIRRLPEFKFCVYFLVLFSITMKRQIRHMIKYKYVPWNFGKKSYAGGKGGPVKSSK